MNKILKIILISIAVFFLALGVIWLIGRNSALRNNKEPLTFREFLGLGTKKAPANTVPDENGSTFTPDGTGNTTGAGTGDGDGTGTGDIGAGANGGVNVSQFTNGGTSPIGTGIGGVGIGGNTSLGTNSPGTSGIGGEGNGSGIAIEIPDGATTGTELECSDEDLNIIFTSEELAQLNTLQNRFYTLAQTLHSDTDVETEVANRDAFTLKANNILSLYAYCESKLPTIAATADPRLNIRVATPFWRSYQTNPAIAAFVGAKTSIGIPTTDPAVESFSFLNFSALNKGHMQDVHDGNKDNPETNPAIKGPYGLLTLTSPEFVPITGSALKPEEVDLMLPVVEKMLRLNLW